MARTKKAGPELRFHKRIFDHLEIEPVVSKKSVAILAEREAACGVAFPASVKEWFSMSALLICFHPLFPISFLLRSSVVKE